jgi:signal transduction histidine kinase/FixJ family two-component response regulator
MPMQRVRYPLTMLATANLAIVGVAAWFGVIHVVTMDRFLAYVFTRIQSRELEEIAVAAAIVVVAFVTDEVLSARRAKANALVAGQATQLADVTNQLEHAQKMEAIGRLAAGVAHDFNNLLTAITGFSELILDEVEADSPVARDVQEILNAGHSATTLTRQLLAFSRKQQLHSEVLSVNDVVTRTDGLLRRLIGEQIELVLRLDPTLDPVAADRGQLEQIIMNIAVNARDAMPDAGCFTIETANVTLDAAYASCHIGAVAGQHVMIAMSDTGIGMDAATQARIFEPFFTTKEDGRGTGLGLSTVYGIVKQSGGSIWVYSEPGRGTTFKVYLPAAGTAAPLEPSATHGTLPGGTETILVVEDQSEVRGVTHAILARQGYTVLEATRGDEAIALAHDYPQPIHLLLTDVVMPGMIGSDLARALRRERPEMRVLYTSGYTDEAISRHGVLEPGVPFIQKPSSVAALSRKIREELDRGRHDAASRVADCTDSVYSVVHDSAPCTPR